VGTAQVPGVDRQPAAGMMAMGHCNGSRHTVASPLNFGYAPCIRRYSE
jgi:hypothetical protein